MPERAVLKFGGSSFASASAYHDVAAYVSDRRKRAGGGIAVVVSAPPGLTEKLRAMLHAVASTPSPQDVDALLPLADTVGADLLAASLRKRGTSATVLTRHRLGIVTDDNFSRARVVSIDEKPLLSALSAHDVVLVPGGQAIDGTGRPTWLGKNSSDLSAMLVAATVGTDVCELFSDVPGVYSTDPNMIAHAVMVDAVSYEDAIAMSESGAKVLHHGAVRLARERGITIQCRLNKGDFAAGTTIGAQAPPVRAVVADQRSVIAEFASGSCADKALAALSQAGVTHFSLPERAGRYRLAVTCGFFDVAGFLAGKGIEHALTDERLVSVFAGKDGIVRYTVPSEKLPEAARESYRTLYPDTPPAPRLPPADQRPAEDGLAEIVDSIA